MASPIESVIYPSGNRVAAACIIRATIEDKGLIEDCPVKACAVIAEDLQDQTADKLIAEANSWGCLAVARLTEIQT